MLDCFNWLISFESRFFEFLNSTFKIGPFSYLPVLILTFLILVIVDNFVSKG